MAIVTSTLQHETQAPAKQRVTMLLILVIICGALFAYYLAMALSFMLAQVRIFGLMTLGVTFGGPMTIFAGLCIAAAIVGIKARRDARLKNGWKYRATAWTLAMAICAAVAEIAVFWASMPSFNYSPVFLLTGKGTLVHWGTASAESSNFSVDGESLVSTSKHYHRYYTEKQQFVFGFNGQNIPYSRPQGKQFTVIADTHCFDTYYEQFTEGPGEFILHAGDFSGNGMRHELAWTMQGFPWSTMLVAIGNHDLYGPMLERIGLEENYAVYFDGVAHYVVNVNAVAFGKGARVDATKVDEAISFLRARFAEDAHKHKFVTIHNPIYSTGEFGSDAYLVQEFEKLQAEFPASGLRAVFSGHDHLFCAFEKNGVLFKMTGNGGALFDKVHSKFVMKDRIWAKSTRSMAGPLPAVGRGTLGYESHLQSDLRTTKTLV